jgi:hypothetical protein
MLLYKRTVLATFRKARSRFFFDQIILPLTNIMDFRYCSMDFIAFAALVGIILPWIFITYDIGCQWSKNFWTRMSDFPQNMQISPETRVDVAIPSWHINGHGQRCRRDFVWVTQRVPEGRVERKWRQRGHPLMHSHLVFERWRQVQGTRR